MKLEKYRKYWVDYRHVIEHVIPLIGFGVNTKICFQCSSVKLCNSLIRIFTVRVQIKLTVVIQDST